MKQQFNMNEALEFVKQGARIDRKEWSTRSTD